MKSPFVGTATTFARSMRWAMSSTASAGIAVMYLTCRFGFAGALSVRKVCVQSAAPVPSSTISLSRYCMFEASVPFTSTVTSLVPAPVGLIPTVRAVRGLDELDRDDRLAGAAGRVLGLVPKRPGHGRAARGRRQRGAGRKGGDQREREQGHKTAKHPACSIGFAATVLYHPHAKTGSDTNFARGVLGQPGTVMRPLFSESGPPSRPDRTARISARIETAVSAGVTAPMSRPSGPRMLAISSSV